MGARKQLGSPRIARSRENSMYDELDKVRLLSALQYAAGRQMSQWLLDRAHSKRYVALHQCHLG